jgi:tRNA (mo5U34)-methyltransferase
MIDDSTFFAYLRTTVPAETSDAFAARTAAALRALSHGDFDRWQAAIEAMPPAGPARVEVDADAVTVAGHLDEVQRAGLKDKLMQLHPWRKGPFELFGVHIDTEWRSDVKWARLPIPKGGGGCERASRIGPMIDLKDKVVLDIGCGNGYYLFRMLGAGAKAVVGVDPFLLYVMQFQAVNRYVKTHRAAVLPLGIEDLPAGCGCFDVVFSMGILYHRRDPKEHLRQLHGFLNPGGQVVLETLILDTEQEEWLVPDGRYAKMRNVWAIASPRLLEKWLGECGFGTIELLDITKTTSHEQRKTDWMTFESLDDFLDPADPTKTIEGHPAPIRAILLAEKR